MLSPGPLQFEATLPVAFECIGYLEHVSDSAHSGLLDLKPGNSQVMFSVEKTTYLAMIYFKWPPFCGGLWYLWILWTFSWKCPERGVWHKGVGYELYVERRTDIARHRVCFYQNWRVFLTLESSHDIIKHLFKQKNNPTKFRQSLTKFANFTAPKFFFAQWSVVFHSQTRPNETFRTLQSYIAPRGWGANLPKSQRSKQKPAFFDGQNPRKSSTPFIPNHFF